MKIDPNWIAGFTDGEGTFYIGINKQPSMSAGYQVLPEFRIVQHERDIKLLHAIKDYFGCGVVRVNHDDRYEVRIRDTSQLKSVIIPFFEKYQLMTQKKFDFIKFKEIMGLIDQNIHLTKEGIVKIIDISSRMNRSDKQKALQIKKLLING